MEIDILMARSTERKTQKTSVSISKCFHLIFEFNDLTSSTLVSRMILFIVFDMQIHLQNILLNFLMNKILLNGCVLKAFAFFVVP